MTASFNLDTLRILLHVLGVTVWLGGQIVMLALVPVLRAEGVEGLPARAAAAFARVAWPAFVLAVVTGIWNILAVNMVEASSGYNIVFAIKLLLVVITGVAAFFHARTDSPALRGATGGLGFLAALGAFVLGYVMSIH